MFNNRAIGVAVVTSLLVGAVPWSVRAEERTIVRSGPSIHLRDSATAAIARLDQTAPQGIPTIADRYKSPTSAQMGPGGGKGMLVFSVVSTVVGLAARTSSSKRCRRRRRRPRSNSSVVRYARIRGLADQKNGGSESEVTTVQFLLRSARDTASLSRATIPV